MNLSIRLLYSSATEFLFGSFWQFTSLCWYSPLFIPFTRLHLAICFLSQSTEHLRDSYLESSIRQPIGLPFFRVMFWRFILVLWFDHVSMFLCMPFNLLLRFGHLKKIDTFLRLHRLFSYSGKPCPISPVREFIDFSNLSWGHVFSRLLLCVIISRLRKRAVSTH